jgi:hypothetical protein
LQDALCGHDPGAEHGDGRAAGAKQQKHVRVGWVQDVAGRQQRAMQKAVVSETTMRVMPESIAPHVIRLSCDCNLSGVALSGSV